ncbi:NAD(P)-binding protein [Lysinibacillus sp. NPDC058147]|uniref:NAD(P)-binding protein n=1 Tax=unclassified Lysinibacillus TaxID=2636778 RepID=UPI0036DF9774
MDDEVVIVGGGIVGIFSALFLADKYKNIYLIENTDRVGGLLNSKEFEGIEFDYGTHIVNETMIKEIDDILYTDFGEEWREIQTFNPGNITFGELYKDSSYPYIINMEEGYENGLIELLSSKEKVSNLDQDLYSYLIKIFGTTYTNKVFRPIFKKLLNLELENLTTDVFKTFDVKRLIVGDEFLTKELKKSEIYDSKIAYPQYQTGSSLNKKYYPNNGEGIGLWIKFLTEKLKEKNVKVLTNTAAIDLLLQEESRITIKNFKNDITNVISPKLIVWTAPFNNFLNVTKEKVNMPSLNFRNTLLMHFIFEKPFISENHYITCWDNSFSFFRVTLYPNVSQNKDVNKCTIEIFFDSDEELEKLTFDFILQELIKAKIIGQDNIVEKQYKEVLYRSFPIIDKKYVQTVKQNEELINTIPNNIKFLGKGKGTSFFINTSILEAYDILKEDLK